MFMLIKHKINAISSILHIRIILIRVILTTKSRSHGGLYFIIIRHGFASSSGLFHLINSVCGRRATATARYYTISIR